MALRRENLDGQSSGALSDGQVEDAFRTIIRWIGEDPDRDGLAETPDRLRGAISRQGTLPRPSRGGARVTNDSGVVRLARA